MKLSMLGIALLWSITHSSPVQASGGGWDFEGDASSSARIRLSLILNEATHLDLEGKCSPTKVAAQTSSVLVTKPDAFAALSDRSKALPIPHNLPSQAEKDCIADAIRILRQSLEGLETFNSQLKTR